MLTCSRNSAKLSVILRAFLFYFMLTCRSIMEIEFERSVIVSLFGFVGALRHSGLMTTNESAEG
jgi:hypothetical protein